MWILSFIAAPFVWLLILIVELKPLYHIIFPVLLFCLLWKPVTLRGFRILGIFVILGPSIVLSSLLSLVSTVLPIKPILYAKAISYWLKEVSLDFAHGVPVSGPLRLRPLKVDSSYRYQNRKSTYKANSSSKTYGYYNTSHSTNQQSSNSNFESQNTSSTNSVATPPTPWEILGVSKGAKKKDIIAAYKAKMMRNHPDKVASLDPEFQKFANERTLAIKNAYEELLRYA